MGRVGAVHDVGVEDAARVLLGEPLELPLRPVALDRDLDARILRLERLLHLLGDLDVDGGVEVDRALLLGRLHQLRRDRRRRRQRVSRGTEQRQKRSMGKPDCAHVVVGLFLEDTRRSRDCNRRPSRARFRAGTGACMAGVGTG
jgi:hypothetical protein